MNSIPQVTVIHHKAKNVFLRNDKLIVWPPVRSFSEIKYLHIEKDNYREIYIYMYTHIHIYIYVWITYTHTYAF